MSPAFAGHVVRGSPLLRHFHSGPARSQRGRRSHPERVHSGAWRIRSDVAATASLLSGRLGRGLGGVRPEIQILKGIAYGLFDTICRGTGFQGSYWYMLLDDYGHPIDTITTYPALFWLHGGM